MCDPTGAVPGLQRGVRGAEPAERGRGGEGLFNGAGPGHQSRPSGKWKMKRVGMWKWEYHRGVCVLALASRRVRPFFENETPFYCLDA